MIYGICGWMSAGKDTIADYMAKHYDYKVHSFADPLKMAVGNIFNWDYVQLQGRTPEDRAKREIVDEWWAEKLGMPDFTQRKALQMIGTDCLRNHFNNEIWASATIKRIVDDMKENPDNNYAIPDCRFPNEIELVRNMGGKIIWVKRGPDPEWKDIGYLASFGDEEAMKHLKGIGVHESEWRWMKEVPDYIVENHGTFDELYENVEKILTL